MKTDPQIVNLTNMRPPSRSDAFAMAVEGVTEIVGVTCVDGKEHFVAPLAKHPGFRAPQISDAYEMAVTGIAKIVGVIETPKGNVLVKPEDRGYVI